VGFSLYPGLPWLLEDFFNWLPAKKEDGKMNKKILVTYASRTGSTAQIAEAICKSLVKNGEEAELLPMENVKDLSSYHAVIIGSPIRKSQWLPEAMQFLQNHRAELARKRVATFTVCITIAMSNVERYQDVVRQWTAPVRELAKPISEGLFAGRLNFRKLPCTLDTLLLRFTVALGVFPKGDHRDWNAVHAWVQDLQSILLQ
jgi:menaquinone-dependent protoporphyrinogen oxidase